MNAMPPPPPPGYGAGGYQQPPPSQDTSGKAIASLVLGIAGFLCCPIICSTIAIVLGKQAQSEIALNPTLGGEGLAKAGFILGIVGLALGVLGLVFYIILIIGSASSA